jgi:hypothetical protein
MIVKLAINERKLNEKLDDKIYWITVYTQRKEDNEKKIQTTKKVEC